MRKKPFLPALVGWLCAAILAVVLPLSTPAVAQLSTQSAAPPVEVSLVADHDSVAPGSPLKLGVHFKIPEGWHIYYREPGETGKPTEVIFTLPAGTTAGDGSKLEWRQPSRFTDFGAVSYGYERDALIATNVTVTEVKAGTTSVTFRAHVTWLACHDECVQGSADVELTLPVATAGSAPQATNADLFAGLKAGDAIRVDAPKPRVLDGSPVEVESMDGGSSSTGFLAALMFAFLQFTTINIYSQVGLITLVGLVAKNGILIVEFANHLQEHGKTKAEAAKEAAMTRLRPILMTSAATVFGHFPLVLVTGAGAEARNSIGIVLVSGMAISTLFTLFVVPSIYVLLAAKRSKVEEASVVGAVSAA